MEIDCSSTNQWYCKKKVMVNGLPMNYNYLSDDSTDLHQAVAIGHLENVRILLKNRADVNAKDSRGAIPLNRLILTREDNSLEIFKLLIEGGTSLAKMDARYFPAGWLMYGSREVIGFLLKTDIDLQHRSDRNQTVLHFLARNPNLPDAHELQRLLIGKNFDVDAVDDKKNTPLMCAVDCANVNMTKFLVENGANVNFTNGKSMPLFKTIVQVCQQDYMEHKIRCCEILLKNGANAQAVLKSGQTIFDKSVEYKNAILVQPIIVHLAIIDELGTPISDFIRSQIDSKATFKTCFEFCKKYLKNIRKIIVYKSMTLFEMLFEMDQEKLIRLLANNPELVLKLERKGEQMKFQTQNLVCLRRMLQKRLDKIITKSQMRSNAIDFIGKIVGLRVNARHIVAEMIVEFLDYRDMDILYKACYK